MDLLTAAIIAGSATSALALKLAFTELQDWLPYLAKWIVDRAVVHLPEGTRERYQEEWRSHLDELPGRLSKLWHATGCLRASAALSKANEVVDQPIQSSATELAAVQLLFTEVVKDWGSFVESIDELKRSSPVGEAFESIGLNAVILELSERLRKQFEIVLSFDDSALTAESLKLLLDVKINLQGQKTLLSEAISAARFYSTPASQPPDPRSRCRPT